MKKDVYLFLTDGFEEIEALATMDVLRRAGVNVTSVSLTGSRVVTGGHGVPVTSDIMFAAVDFAAAKMLVLPGGTEKINEHEGLKAQIHPFVSRSGVVAAICAAPMVLGGLGLLEGRHATCYPGFEKYLRGAILETDKAVVKDGNIITGRGPGLTLDFALELVRTLSGQDKANEVAAGLLL